MYIDIYISNRACSLLLSGGQAGGRKALWAVNAPKILAVGYEQEDDAEAMGAFEKIGGLVRTNEVQVEDYRFVCACQSWWNRK